jgi:hypothetical protein
MYVETFNTGIVLIGNELVLVPQYKLFYVTVVPVLVH